MSFDANLLSRKVCPAIESGEAGRHAQSHKKSGFGVSMRMIGSMNQLTVGRSAKRTTSIFPATVR